MPVAHATERKKQDERRVHLLAVLTPFYGKITKLLHALEKSDNYKLYMGISPVHIKVGFFIEQEVEKFLDRQVAIGQQSKKISIQVLPLTSIY